MAHALQFVVVFTFPLLMGDAAVAQPTTAPHPHLALDELAREYKRLGLPMPAPQAKLVRLSWGVSEDELYKLAFRHPPTKPGGVPHYLTGCKWWFEVNPTWREVVVQPASVSLGDSTSWGGICFAVQCKLLGWDDLAAAAYDAWRRENSKPPEEAPDPIAWLRYEAWSYWEHQLFEPKSDRKEILARLRSLSKAGLLC